MSLADEFISGIEEAQSDIAGNPGDAPMFTWLGTNYPCVPSITEMKRDLDAGGFVIDKLLTMVVEMQNLPLPIPESQQLVYYQGDRFRIISKKVHPTNAYVRYICQSDVRGL